MLAIIPARGGSKGLARKNIRLLKGKPLIAYSIEAALNAASITRVIVSTDSEEIKDVSEQYGAEIPFMRPAYLASDEAMVMDTYFFVIEELARQEGNMRNNFVALLPTAPLRRSMDIDEAVRIFKEKGADSVISVTESPLPPQWFLDIRPDGALRGYFPAADGVSNRQLHRKAYVPNGAIYVFNYDQLKKTRQYYHARTFPYIMPRERSVDIDSQIDLDWAELMLSQQGVS